MSTAGRWSLLSKPLILGGALCLLMIGGVGLVWASFVNDFFDNERGVVTASIPPRPSEPGEPIKATDSPTPDAPGAEARLANPAFTEPTLDPIKPNEPDLQLVDASPFGPLPRIADDGRRSIETYSRPHDQLDDQPQIAIIVTGLGQQADATNATFHLPGAISLMFSAYSEDMPTYFERARLAGHEVLLELPMEPLDYPASDPGPHTLRASGTVDANIERLNWVLARAPGYFAVAGQSGAFGSSAEAAPIMLALAAKGVGLIEIDGDDLEKTSAAAGLTYMSTSDWIDASPSAEGIDKALGDLEIKAKETGYAVGVAEAYPITLQRLVEWTTTLENRGITLVPASAILLQTSDAAASKDQASTIVQSQN